MLIHTIFYLYLYKKKYLKGYLIIFCFAYIVMAVMKYIFNFVLGEGPIPQEFPGITSISFRPGKYEYFLPFWESWDRWIILLKDFLYNFMIKK